MVVKNNSIFVIYFCFGGDGIELLGKPYNTFAE